jgi:pyrroloquinoline quinone (PQQ) biosynthesis protein C
MPHPWSELFQLVDGRPVVSPEVHPLPGLLTLSPQEILENFRVSQARDFAKVAAAVELPASPLYGLFAEMRARVPEDNPFHRLALFRPGALNAHFVELHEHVMAHPVWLHPFFLRVFEGRFDKAQALAFAIHYFNQVKNTRQCVAMAIGRFHGLAPMPYGPLNERISEISQIMLGQLVADEYGVGAHDLSEYPSLDRLMRSHTHIAMYRQLFEGLGAAPNDQDAPMLQGVADNVLTQRMLAGDPAFTPLEALASVGLGMEWGVPEFFSLLLGGLIRFSWQNEAPLTRRHLEVFIAHVRYDVLHALAVMLATAFHMRNDNDVDAVKDACNTLMAARHDMMSDMHRHVFGEPCPRLAEIGVAPRYRLRDGRAAEQLIRARRSVAPERVVDGEAYRERADAPFVLA